MEVKKSEKANLEEKKFLFREIGFVVVLLVIWGAFELGLSESNVVIDRGDGINEDDMEMVEVTREPDQPEPEQPKPELPEPPQDPQIEETTDESQDQSEQVGADKDANAEIPEEKFNFDDYADENEKPIFMKVEKMPTINGEDYQKFAYKYIMQVLDYPAEAQDLGVSGMVVVQFEVNSKGKVANAKVVKPVHPLLDKAALDAVAKLPDAVPGEQAGQKVRIMYSLPIQFKM